MAVAALKNVIGSEAGLVKGGIMALFTIADLHLSFGTNKPMDVFGKAWENYTKRLKENWQAKVSSEDTVVIPGDISWGTYLADIDRDFSFLNELNGRKIILKGNHDFWWTTLNKLNRFVEKKGISNIFFLQNNAFFYQDTALCGTRGWVCDDEAAMSEDDLRLYKRELLRLELSLEYARKMGAQNYIVFLHYPPVLKNLKPDENYLALFHQYGVTDCVYGHLHADAHQYARVGMISDIHFHLVSADYLGFTPLKILE